MSSCVVGVPIVVSVPKWHKCLVVGDTKLNLVAVGLFVVWKSVVFIEARVVNRAAIPEFHVNVLPFAIVAINTWPKLSNDQRPGSSETSDAGAASPQST